MNVANSNASRLLQPFELGKWLGFTPSSCSELLKWRCKSPSNRRCTRVNETRDCPRWLCHTWTSLLSSIMYNVKALKRRFLFWHWKWVRVSLDTAVVSVCTPRIDLRPVLCSLLKLPLALGHTGIPHRKLDHYYSWLKKNQSVVDLVIHHYKKGWVLPLLAFYQHPYLDWVNVSIVFR